MMSQNVRALLQAIQSEKDMVAVHALADLLMETSDTTSLVEVLATLGGINPNSFLPMKWTEFSYRRFTNQFPPYRVRSMHRHVAYLLRKETG